jgi:hypothetical protein
MIFLDPDNGFKVKSATRRRLPKYARYEEAQDYFEQGKIVIGIQFAGMCYPIDRARKNRSKLMNANRVPNLPVIHVHVVPNILFIFLCDASRASRLKRSLNSFEEGSYCLPLIKGANRIALID